MFHNVLSHSKAKNPLNSLIKALTLLSCFTASNPELGTSEVARKLEISKATAHRILTTFLEFGMLERCMDTRKYRVGLELYLIGNLYAETLHLVKVCEPVLELVNDLTSESTSLGILDNGNIVLILLNEPKHSYRILRHAGTTAPAYASSRGKALLSTLSDSEIDKYYPEEELRRITPKTIASKNELKRELTQIRKSGIAFDREGGYEGVEGIAALIYDAKNNAVAAASITVPIFKLNKRLRREYSILIKETCHYISFRLGFREKASTIRTIEDLKNWWIERDSNIE